MMITDIILKLKRLMTPLKFVGFAFLVFHCATVDIRFNPIWVLVYVVVALVIATASIAIKTLFHKIHLAKGKPGNGASLTAEENRCLGQLNVQSLKLRAKPWQILLIAGEDGLFFLPLLYIGVSVPAVIAGAAFFTIMHYRDKPLSALPSTFLFSAANALIVLPHGILPMVFGHLVLDVTSISLIPMLKRRVDQNQQKMDKSNQASDAISEPVPSPDSSSHQG